MVQSTLLDRKLKTATSAKWKQQSESCVALLLTINVKARFAENSWESVPSLQGFGPPHLDGTSSTSPCKTLFSSFCYHYVDYTFLRFYSQGGTFLLPNTSHGPKYTQRGHVVKSGLIFCKGFPASPPLRSLPFTSSFNICQHLRSDLCQFKSISLQGDYKSASSSISCESYFKTVLICKKYFHKTVFAASCVNLQHNALEAIVAVCSQNGNNRQISKLSL